MRAFTLIVSLTALVVGVFYVRPAPDLDSSPSVPPSIDTAAATQLLNRQPGFFVPNLGQWDHAAKFVHRSGPMTLFLEDRGWVLDLAERSTRPVVDSTRPAPMDDRDTDQESRGVALRMTFESAFEGDSRVPEIVGEKKLPGHYNYFLGSDESRWRTAVPLYSSVRYENLYAGIDLRLREVKGVPEYDLLLQPGSDLSLVTVHVEGGKSLSIAKDGSLIIETALGPLTQSVPKTWQVGSDGRKHEVDCNFTLLGAARFGFAAPGWGGDTSLTIDPGLIWSTFLGGGGVYGDTAYSLAVDAIGVVTVAGITYSVNFPTTSGAYDTTFNGVAPYYIADAFVSRLDPSKSGAAQLVYSTFLGGSASDYVRALSVDASGVVTVAGATSSTNFPTTSGAYDTTKNRDSDVFVSRLDPSKTGAAQLVYSTYLGGNYVEFPYGLFVDASGMVTVVGLTGLSRSTNDFPTTVGAYDRTYNGGLGLHYGDAFVSRLDPRKTGAAQLVYSTYLGGINSDYASAVSVDASGIATVSGASGSPNFPTTPGAYKAVGPGAFVVRLDARRTGAAQLVYSTFLQGGAVALSVDASGVVTVAGHTYSNSVPTTSGAYDSTHNGDFDVFVTSLDPSKTGAAQLVYATYMGGNARDVVEALFVDASGVVTVAGSTESPNFPTTSDAYDTTYTGGNSGGDVFVTRLDPKKTGAAQLVYGSFLGGSSDDIANALAVDLSGVVTVAGRTTSSDFPTTSGAYDTTYNAWGTFISRLDMGVALYGDLHEVSIKTGGTQRFAVNAGKAQANRLYWIFGSITGTKPGLNLPGVHIPLNPDLYTNIAMGAVNTTVFSKFKGTLDAKGLATASFNVPANLPVASGFTFDHAYVVYDASGRFYLASNAVPLRLK